MRRVIGVGDLNHPILLSKETLPKVAIHPTFEHIYYLDRRAHACQKESGHELRLNLRNTQPP